MQRCNHWIGDRSASICNYALCSRFLGPPKGKKKCVHGRVANCNMCSCFCLTQEKHPQRWRRRGFRGGSYDGWSIWRCRKGKVSEHQRERESYCTNWEMHGSSLFNTYYYPLQQWHICHTLQFWGMGSLRPLKDLDFGWINMRCTAAWENSDSGPFRDSYTFTTQWNWSKRPHPKR